MYSHPQNPISIGFRTLWPFDYWIRSHTNPFRELNRGKRQIPGVPSPPTLSDILEPAFYAGREGRQVTMAALSLHSHDGTQVIANVQLASW